MTIVVGRHAPLFVVIREIEGIAPSGPFTAAWHVAKSNVLSFRKSDGLQGLRPLAVILKSRRLPTADRPYLSDARVNYRAAAPATAVNPDKGDDLVAGVDELFGVHHRRLFPGLALLLEELHDAVASTIDLGIDEPLGEIPLDIRVTHIEKTLHVPSVERFEDAPHGIDVLPGQAVYLGRHSRIYPGLEDLNLLLGPGPVTRH